MRATSKPPALPMRPTILCLVIAAMLTLPGMAGADPLLLATGEWAPYSSRDMDKLGVFPEILDLVFQEMGEDHTVRFYPWKRCYKMVVDGDAWAAFPYSSTKQRAREVLYSDPVSHSTTVFFTYGQGPDIPFRTLADLKGYRIGGISGYFYKETFDKTGLEVTYVPDEQSALQMLEAGRVDLVPLNEFVGRHIITRLFPDRADRFHTLPRPLSRNELALIVSPGYPGSRALLERFNTALAKVLESGEPQRIMHRHGLR